MEKTTYFSSMIAYLSAEETCPEPISVITQRSRATTGSRDMVEIEPVRLGADGKAVPVFGPEVRGSSRFNVKGPGKFELKKNAGHVPGAYANLRHHQAASWLRQNGLDLKAGVTHLLPREYANLSSISFDIETDGSGALVYGKECLLMALALKDAAEAARGTNATHVAIRIR